MKKFYKRHRKLKMVFTSIALAMVLLLIALVLIDGTFMRAKYLSVWSKGYVASLDSDEKRIIAGALKAASSHNMQPWLIQKSTLEVDTYELYANMAKDLKVIDQDKTQLLIGQGTFIEAYIKTASEYGYNVALTLHKPDLNQPRPHIATFKLEKVSKKINVDAVSACTSSSTSVALKMIKAASYIKKALAPYPNLDYAIINGQQLMEFKNNLLKAVIIESTDQEAIQEQLDVFRWTEWDKNKYRNGLTLKDMSPLVQHSVQPIMKFLSSDWESYGKQGINQFRTRLENENQYVLVTGDGNFENFINVGRAYQALGFSMRGYAIRPAVQLLETFEEMKPLSDEFQKKYGKGKKVLLLFGVEELQEGKKVTAPGPRHFVEDILINK